MYLLSADFTIFLNFDLAGQQLPHLGAYLISTVTIHIHKVNTSCDTCWYCASVFSNLQQVVVVCFDFMKNIQILFRQLIQHMGQCHVDTHHFLRRERERSISQIT